MAALDRRHEGGAAGGNQDMLGRDLAPVRQAYRMRAGDGGPLVEQGYARCLEVAPVYALQPGDLGILGGA